VDAFDTTLPKFGQSIHKQYALVGTISYTELFSVMVREVAAGCQVLPRKLARKKKMIVCI
jgi:hypothetical protein